MSIATGFKWSHDGIHLVGYSLAGITSSIAFPDADVVFDVGQGLPWSIPYNNILLTHGHMDHASGLPYLIGQKAMASKKAPLVYMPSELIGPMREIMKVWERIEEHPYAYEFRTPNFGQDYPLKSPYFFRIFPTHHRVPSLGYTVFIRKKHLSYKYKHLSREEIIQLRHQGIDPNEAIDVPLLSYTGDTRIEFLQSAPWIKESKVLLTEVTYLDQQKSIENTRHWGHLHIDELIPELSQLRCEKIVLCHISARYTTKMITEILDARIPEHFKHRIDVFPRSI